MVPTTREIVWQMAVLREMYPKETISELASRLMLSPIFIINALDEAEKMELFRRTKNKKGELTEVLETMSPVDWESLEGPEFGEDIMRLQEEMVRAVASANSDENDVESGTLQAWCRGIRPSAIEIALEFLYHKVILGRYELADPGDEKSVYTFYSLRVNVANKWGAKQFKKAKKAKK